MISRSIVAARGPVGGLARLVFALVLGLGAGCASPTASPGAAEAHTVSHEGFGVRANLEGWQVYTDGRTAPAMLRPAFADKQGPDDPPLFVALKEGAIFVALVRPVVGGDTRSFFDLLSEQTAKQGEVTSAVQLEGRDDILFTSRVGPGAVAAHTHSLVHVEAGRFVNLMVSGTGEPVPDDLWLDALGRVELRSEGGWSAPWRSLSAPVAGTALPGYLDPVAEPEDPFQDVTCLAGEHPAIWSTPTETGRLFLFGSIHFGHASFYPFPPAIESAFEGAERLVVEARVDASAELGPDSPAFEGMGLPEGKRLPDLISPELYRKLEQAAADMGIPVSIFDAMSPSVAGLTLATLPYIMRGFDPRDGVDVHFLERASEKEVVELESLQEQLELIRRFDRVFLESAIEGLDRVDEEIDALYRGWRCGDVAALERTIFVEPRERAETPEDLEAYESFIDAFLIGRNERMSASLRELMKRDGDSFVVIGAAHLVGDQGVPALLRAAGHEVERVTP